MIQITLSDLVYINEAAKAIKCSDVMWIKNKLVGIDNLNYIIYCALDESKLSILPDRGLVFNQRGMAKFMKSIPYSSYSIDDTLINNNITLTTSVSDYAVTITISAELDNIVGDKLRSIFNYDIAMAQSQEEYMSEKLSDIYSLNKTAGGKLYKHDSEHILTLFGGLLPLTKADKLYMTLYDNPDNTFLARFRVAKKRFTIFVYIMYISI